VFIYLSFFILARVAYVNSYSVIFVFRSMLPRLNLGELKIIKES